MGGNQLDDQITIPQYFAGKTIFVTGASGFMGKVLLEKILRSCPEVKRIYILLRPKKGKSPTERVKMITDLPLFDVLKKERPENLKKLVPVSGDVTQLQLGLSQEETNILTEEVNIIYHAAASVRFDDPLKDAIIMNTRGTREVVYLAKQMKNLEILVHLSTSYCHTDRKVIAEEIYPPHADWKDSIYLAENVDKHVLDVLTAKYTEPLPNTYTFTKSMAEHVINDLCDGQIPAIIVRPSIVISTQEEPVPGWVDNFNGPVGILVASGKGILRSVYTDPNIMADYVPVDVIIKGLLMATWGKGIEENKEEKYKLSIYNASNNKINNITIGELVDMGELFYIYTTSKSNAKYVISNQTNQNFEHCLHSLGIGKKLCWDYPLNDVLWYPSGGVTNCYFMHFIRLIFYHLLPALLIDGILKLAGQKPILFKVQRKIYIANMALQYFITQEWDFLNDKASALEYSVLPSDKKAFSIDRKMKPFEYFTKGLYGARLYLLREDPSTFEKAKIHSKRMYYIAQVTDILWYIGVLYVLVFKLNILSVIWNYIVSSFDV